MGFPPGAVLVIAMTAWVALDAARRGRHWFAWAGLTAVTGPLGLLIWLVARRPSPVARRMDAAESLMILIAAVPLFLLTTLMTITGLTFVVQFARVEGQTMAPTLRDQDRVIVSKLAYHLSEPRRGDIVMMYYPLDPAHLFVKRVIAEENDEVHIISGRVQLNGVPIEEPFVAPDSRSRDIFGPYVVPQGYCFVMGDARNDSRDSRHWGVVPTKYIIGKVTARWWPLSEIARF